MDGFSAFLILFLFTLASSYWLVSINRYGAALFATCFGLILIIATILCLPFEPKIGDSIVKDDIIITTVYEEYLFGYKEVSVQWVYYDNKWCLYSPKNLLVSSDDFVINTLNSNLERVKQLNKVDKILQTTKK